MHKIILSSAISVYLRTSMIDSYIYIYYLVPPFSERNHPSAEIRFELLGEGAIINVNSTAVMLPCLVSVATGGSTGWCTSKDGPEIIPSIHNFMATIAINTRT